MKGTIVIEIMSTPGENTMDFSNRIAKYEKIFRDLIKTGSLDGIRGGSAQIHFDDQTGYKGIFHGYWPYKERA